MKTVLTSAVIGVLVAASAQAATVQVTATGTVLFNGVSDSPLSAVSSGETATMILEVDTDTFVEGVPGDTRGYEIQSFMLMFESASVGLLDPFPSTPYFTLVEGFPVSDGFFVSSSAVSPGGVALSQEPLQFNLDIGYDGATLGSLDILDAVGTYGFGGLTRFGFTLWQISPDNVRMEMDFVEMTIEEVVATPTVDTSWSNVKATF